MLTTAYFEGDFGYVITNERVLEFLQVHKASRITWHNASFDIAVLEKATEFKFDKQIVCDRILDTRILYRLVNIAVKGYAPKRNSLAVCIKQAFDYDLDKDKDIRLTFGDYLNEDGTARYDEISDRHYKYAVLDSVATQAIKVSLLKKIESLPTSTNLSHTIQLMGEIALDDIKRRGIGVDLEYTNNLRDQLQSDMDRNAEVLLTYGLMRGKGFQQKYENVIKHLELDIPITEKTKKISMKGSDLELYKGNHFVDALLDYLEIEHRKDFLKLLTESRVHPRYDSIKNTLRTSCSKPNVQNPPRTGGIREAFIPKEGHVFVDIDYSSIELYALAYICKKDFGYSVLYDKLQQGADVHVYAASKIFNISEDQVTKSQRQIAKICNYGLAANMGKDTFSRHMRNNDVDFNPEQAGEVKKLWKKAFPEIEDFWKRAQGRYMVVTDTGFIRTNCTYTAYLNTQFQSKVAEGCKLMLYNLYTQGFKTVAYIHDQVVLEAKKENAENVLKEASKIMIDSMKIIIPGMCIKVEGEIKDRYSK